MHKRKNNWPILTYKYAAWPVGKPPKQFWEMADRMVLAWNKIVQAKLDLIKEGQSKAER